MSHTTRLAFLSTMEVQNAFNLEQTKAMSIRVGESNGSQTTPLANGLRKFTLKFTSHRDRIAFVIELKRP